MFLSGQDDNCLISPPQKTKLRGYQKTKKHEVEGTDPSLQKKTKRFFFYFFFEIINIQLINEIKNILLLIINNS